MKNSLVILSLCGIHLAAQACPTEVPAGLQKVTNNAGSMINPYSGTTPMFMIGGTKSAAEMQNVAAIAWAKSGFEVKKIESGKWRIVAAISSKCMSTLHLINQDDSTGAFGFFFTGLPKNQRIDVFAFKTPKTESATILSKFGSDIEAHRAVTVATNTLRSSDEIHFNIDGSLK
jgi:hypothetical protein